MKRVLTLFALSFLLLACGNEQKTQNTTTSAEKNSTEENEKACTYSIDYSAIQFEWTAFKTTEKLAVKGTFDEIAVKNHREKGSLADVVNETEFMIALNSINSKNEGRDEKLKKFFFGNLNNSEYFKGVTSQYEGNDTEGEVIIELHINEIGQNVVMKYKIEEGRIHFEGKLNLLEWETQNSLDALNTACLDLHKGADGISKTWAEMDIAFSFPIEKNCK